MLYFANNEFFLGEDMTSPPASVTSTQSLDLQAIETLQNKIQQLSAKIEKIQREVEKREEEQEYSHLTRISKMSTALVPGMQPKSTEQTRDQVKVIQSAWFHDLNTLRDQEPFYQSMSGTKFKVLKQPTSVHTPSILDLVSSFGFFNSVILEQGNNSERKALYRLLYCTNNPSVIEMDGSTCGLTGLIFDEKKKHFCLAIEWVNSSHPQAANICSSMCISFSKASIVESGRRQNFKNFERLLKNVSGKEYKNLTTKIIVANAPNFLSRFGDYVLTCVVSFDGILHNFQAKTDAEEKNKLAFRENQLHVNDFSQRQQYNPGSY